MKNIERVKKEINNYEVNSFAHVLQQGLSTIDLFTMGYTGKKADTETLKSWLDSNAPFTKKDAELAKAIKVLYPSAKYITKDDYGHLYIHKTKPVLDKWFWNTENDADTMPIKRLGETAFAAIAWNTEPTLIDDIIGNE